MATWADWVTKHCHSMQTKCAERVTKQTTSATNRQSSNFVHELHKNTGGIGNLRSIELLLTLSAFLNSILSRYHDPMFRPRLYVRHAFTSSAWQWTIAKIENIQRDVGTGNSLRIEMIRKSQWSKTVNILTAILSQSATRSRLHEQKEDSTVLSAIENSNVPTTLHIYECIRVPDEKTGVCSYARNATNNSIIYVHWVAIAWSSSNRSDSSAENATYE